MEKPSKGRMTSQGYTADHLLEIKLQTLLYNPGFAISGKYYIQQESVTFGPLTQTGLLPVFVNKVVLKQPCLFIYDSCNWRQLYKAAMLAPVSCLDHSAFLW